MEALDRLQRHMHTLGELRTIVRTMKALSAVSTRQYERAVDALGGYYRTVALGLQVVLQGTRDTPPPGAPRRGAAPSAAIVFGSDHGLCGRFNEDMAAHARERLAARGIAPARCRVLAVGARIATSLEHDGQPVEEIYFVPGSAARITATVQEILRKVDAWRREADVRDIHLFYNHHRGAKGYEPTDLALLPVDFRRFQALQAERWPSRRLPTFTMERNALLAALLRQYFFVSIFRACAESQASEHTSRLAAMVSAERHLDERVEEVGAMLRRLRQEAITTELLDVVAGFEAATAGGGAAR
ncbi:MAG: F0F1 ATP synthase subunit gamma [Gammaproteobacteria bacterium]|nr:F0F1 ATP synthase subunit gamma [Gammaproteobacteria bacterium]